MNFIWHPWKKIQTVKELPPMGEKEPEEETEMINQETFRMYNKLPENHHLSNKKTFFSNYI